MKIRLSNNQMEEIEGLCSEYPYTLHRVDLRKTSVPWHWHEEVEFIYIVSGEAKFMTTNHAYYFHAGEAFFINTNVLCSLERIGECHIESHLFHSTFLSGHFRSIFESKYLNPVLQNKQIEVVELRGKTRPQTLIVNKLKQIATLQKEENKEFQTRNLFSEIWLLLLEEIETLETKKQTISNIHRDRLFTMLSYIQENYTDKLTLEDIAASAMISSREALRCFQSNIHQTPFEYLLNYRIESAKKLLKSSTLSITEIASKTGFSNSAYFSKIFKRTCNQTPMEYRKGL